MPKDGTDVFNKPTAVDAAVGDDDNTVSRLVDIHLAVL